MTSIQQAGREVASSRKRGFWLIFVGGLLVGVGGFAGFHFLLMDGFTNSLEMCVSCHEMDGVYREYQKSTHYKNPAGVRVVCASCHIPHGKGVGDYLDKLVDKVVVGGRHLFHHLKGTYPDANAFESARYRLSQDVLANMRQRDSKECRQCHTYESMQFSSQGRSAASKHERVMKEGSKTCVDCHSGIVHELPEEPASPEGGDKK
ncbi:MAG: NapC/NirT family cytochrome c [Magnetococcales bacterium]|nr:NapC/NirT family cytochrome c [Magnetococcales bacterium]